MNLDKLQQQFANKSANYWAKMRTNLSMIGRSDFVDETYIDEIRRELSDILDSGILTYPHTLTQLGLEPDQSLKERKQQLGLSTTPLVHSEAEQRFLDDMAHKADQVRKGNWSWRIAEEAEEKQKLKWHPFFVTLTIDPNKTDPKALWTEGREFRKYIRRLANVVCKEMGHDPCHKKPYRPESNYVTYAGVIEHGKSREHHHGHFIIWLRAIPASWRVCPNAGIRNPANRVKNECLPMRTLWPWSLPGLSKALYFRSVGDIWSTEYNFVLPLKSGKPMKISVPRTAGLYITKYLAKEHREWHHRMKATRNLGMRKLRQTLESLDETMIEALTWRAENSNTNLSLMTIHSCPLGLLRSEAKRRSYLLRFRSNRLDLKTLLTSNSGIFNRMLSSVTNGARPERMDSFQFFDWVGEFLPVQKGYSRTKQIIAHTYLASIFPPDKNRVQHTNLGGNEIGHS